MKTKHLILAISFIFLIATGSYLTSPITWDTSTALFIISLFVFLGTTYFGMYTKKFKKFYKWLNKAIWVFLLMFVPSVLSAQMAQDSLSLSDYLFTGLSYTLLESAYIFAGIGLILRWALKTRKGIKRKDNNSPMEFDLMYWLKDNFSKNIASVLSVIIVLFLLFRFTGEIYNMKLSMFIAFLGGFGIEYLITKISKLKIK